MRWSSCMAEGIRFPMVSDWDELVSCKFYFLLSSFFVGIFSLMLKWHDFRGYEKVSIFNCYYFLVATSLVSTFGYYSENKSLGTSLPHYFLTLYSLRWCFFFTNKKIISIGLKDYIYFTIVPRKNSCIDYMLCIFLEVGISFSTSVR